jgi:colicin import membrane protein
MKPWVAGFLCLLLVGLGDTQAQADGQQIGLDEHRASLSQERSRLEAGFSAEDAACHQRFSVNSCLEKVDVKRRAALAQLRSQEILLNDEERKNRAEAQRRKTEEKSSAESLQQAARQRAVAVEDYRLRLERDKNRQQERAASPSSQQSARDAHSQKLMAHQKKAQARAARQAESASEARKSDARKKQAQARRARHEADQLSRPPAKSRPLPESPG